VLRFVILCSFFFRTTMYPDHHPSDVRLAGCWCLVLICSERKVLLGGY
jgi:hypothetical protein